MFRLFIKKNNRIDVEGNNIFIDNQKGNIGKAIELEPIFKLTKATPEIKVYENRNLVCTFLIETLESNPDLAGQFFHSSIRVLSNSAVMIDGIISKSDTTYPKWTDNGYEAIRLQPFFLSDKNENNINLEGKGLFERGLHFNGTVTPSDVRNICICDSCNLSFTIKHFHAGFSEVQYFYSTDSKETLIVPYGTIENLPVQLQESIDDTTIENIEQKLPKASENHGTFNYYNSFRCPHCLTPYIDFEKHKEIRRQEYYGNTYLNDKPKRWTDQNGS